MRPVRRAILQHLADHGLVGKAEDIIEVAPGVLRVAAGVRTAQDGDGSLRSEQVGERVSEEGGLSKRADEDEVDLVRQIVDQVLETRVADEGDLVPFRFAPHRDDLRHDAGEIRVHDARVQRAGRRFGDQIDDADTELTQRFSLAAASLEAASKREPSHVRAF